MLSPVYFIESGPKFQGIAVLGISMVFIVGYRNPMDMNWSKLQEMVKDREAWHAAVRGVTKSWTRPSD